MLKKLKENLLEYQQNRKDLPKDSDGMYILLEGAITVKNNFNSKKLINKDKDGKDFPDWEEKRLMDFLNYYDGTHQTPKYVEKGVKFFSVEHLTANQFDKTKEK